MTVELITIQPGPMDKAELVERAARLCYNSEMSKTAGKRKTFIQGLIRRGHLSVTEHARWLHYSRTGDPHARYWPVRYGVNITPCVDRGFPWLVSFNARNLIELDGYNPLFGSGDLVSYDILTDAEKLAHTSATFLVSGISRACSHQGVRHRVNSPSQESQRYVAAVAWEPVVPPTIANHPDEQVRVIYTAAMDDAKWSYGELQEYGIPREDARYVLPNACPTRLMITATFEHWRLFLSQRLPLAAQWEIRQNVAGEIHAALMEVEPELFGDLAVSE